MALLIKALLLLVMRLANCITVQGVYFSHQNDVITS